MNFRVKEEPQESKATLACQERRVTADREDRLDLLAQVETKVRQELKALRV